MITMMLGGLWHGAAWLFVIWGAWHGLLAGGVPSVEETGAHIVERPPGRATGSADR